MLLFIINIRIYRSNYKDKNKDKNKIKLTNFNIS